MLIEDIDKPTIPDLGHTPCRCGPGVNLNIPPLPGSSNYHTNQLGVAVITSFSLVAAYLNP